MSAVAAIRHQIDYRFEPMAIRAFVDGLVVAGIPRVIANSDPNIARPRAYAKAGFRDAGLIDTLKGPALLMLCDNPKRH